MTDYPKALAAALDAQKPSGFAYRYRDALAGGTVIRFNSGHEVNGSRPIEAVPYWLGAPPAPVALAVPATMADGWRHDICTTLNRVIPSWIAAGKTPIEAACNAIEALAAVACEAHGKPAALAVPDDAMVERALKVLAFEHDGALFPDNYSDEEADAERETMRKVLAAALEVKL